jgi:5-methylcytosine-specific restriction endonuclease McrA
MSASTIVTSDHAMLTRVSTAVVDCSPASSPADSASARPLPASQVEARLVAALSDLDAARKNAVIWFGEILTRKLYLEFGCSSIYHYASTRLGFSRARTAYFLRLCRSFDALPALKESVASGAVPWTKAREVVKVATPETESFWVEQARTTGRRELEQRVAATQGAARARRRVPGQGDLLSGRGAGGPADQQAGAERDPGDESAGEAVRPVVEVPVTVSFQLSPEQYARYEAMLECARKNGARGSREELFLAAWEMITRGNMPVANATPVLSAPRYQIVIRQCETCGRAEIATGRGAVPIAAKTLEAALCDARVHRTGQKNRATIPPSVRREVLARDGHRCRTAGCGGAHFLDVHHIKARADGGSNDPDNLITLCAACHRMIHDRADGGVVWPLRRDSRIDAHPGEHGDGCCRVAQRVRGSAVVEWTRRVAGSRVGRSPKGREAGAPSARTTRDTRSDAEFRPAPRNRHLVVLAPCLARV